MTHGMECLPRGLVACGGTNRGGGPPVLRAVRRPHPARR